MTETAVAILQARGEPARTERLLGEILVGLDRAGHLRRLVAPEVDGGAADGEGEFGGPAEDRSRRLTDRLTDRGPDRAMDRPARPPDRSESSDDGEPDIRPSPRSAPGSLRGLPAAYGRESVRAPEVAVAADRVERLLALVRAELARPDHRRLKRDRAGSLVADRPGRRRAAPRCPWPIASSGRSSACCRPPGGCPKRAFNERIAGLFTGHDLPDEALVGACLESYRSLASTPDHLLTSDDLLRRSQEHSELIALLANLGHRLGPAGLDLEPGAGPPPRPP